MSEPFPELEELIGHLVKLPREKLIPDISIRDLECHRNHKPISDIICGIKFWKSIND